MLYYNIMVNQTHGIDERTGDSFEIREFGVKAEEVFTADVLTKHIVDEAHAEGWSSKTQTSTNVYLCYNWKLKLPFVIVKHTVSTKHSGYTPQYGRDSNYVHTVKSQSTCDFYSLETLAAQRPEVVSVLSDLE